jgi:uncharacterized protein (DUF488 family)
MKPSVFTIGHSNDSLEHFLCLLNQHRIEALVDIRRFPGSRKYPHFNQQPLAAALPMAGMEYHWLEALGGRRSVKKGASTSPNLGLRNESFRNYADYMLTEEFRQAIKDLLAVASHKRAAIMCAEAVFWRCHRRLVSDFLLANGVAVQHIFPNGEVKPHKFTEGAKVEEGVVTYPGTDLFT